MSTYPLSPADRAANVADAKRIIEDEYNVRNATLLRLANHIVIEEELHAKLATIFLDKDGRRLISGTSDAIPRNGLLDDVTLQNFTITNLGYHRLCDLLGAPK